MKKNDLIKKLQQIQGNPDIVLWNGLVGDYMDIGNFVEDYLTKYTKEFYKKVVLMEEPTTTQEEIETYYRKLPYEYNQHISLDNYSGEYAIYKKKRVVFIDAKKKGKTYFDRIGNVRY